jgi:hypothetical protein
MISGHGTRAAFVAVVALVAVSSARAQQLPEPGARVRVHLTARRDNAPVIGAVDAWRPDTLLLLGGEPPAPRAIPLREIQRLEVHAGEGPGTAQGFQSGAILGGLAGLAIAARAGHTETNLKYGLGVSLGALTGGAVGAIVGSARRAERWRAAPLPLSGGRTLADLPASFEVRVTDPARFDAPREGRLLSRADDSLTFLPKGRRSRPVTLATRELTKLEVAEGKGHQAWKGAAAFGLTGAVLGGLAGAALSSYAGGDNTAAIVTVSALALGGIGMVTGMFVGGMVESERWESVPLSARDAGDAPDPAERAPMALADTAASASCRHEQTLAIDLKSPAPRQP